MTKILKGLGLALLAAVLIGYAYTQYRNRQAVQWAQLQALDDALAGLNAQAQKANDDAMRRMQYTVEANHNQPREVELLNAAKEVQDRTRQLLGSLQACREQLLRQTGNHNSAEQLRSPTAEVTLSPEQTDAQTSSVEARFGAYVRYIRAIPGRVLHPADSLRQPTPAIPAPLAPLSFGKQPIGVALTTLTQLEADVFAYEALALEWLSQPLGARRVPRTMAAVATAETNVVAPGATYKAQLYLVNNLYGPGISMSCNGQPIAVAPNGMGEVRFRAPAHTGAAAWLGTVRVRYQGRDSTFTVRVPYRVACP